MQDNKMKSEESNQIKEFSNENIRLRVESKPHCLVHLEISVTAQAVKAAYEKALKQVKKEVSLPGFRKGKAPEDIIMRNFGKTIEREWKDLVLQTAFRESIALCGIYPFTKNSVRRTDLKKCSKDDGAEIVIEYECEPQVPKIDINSLSLQPKAPKKIIDKTVELEIKKLQVMHATWEEITDRPVAIGDFVELDIDVIELPAHNICIDQLFSVEKEELPDWIYDLIVGMSLNESKEGTAIPEVDIQNEFELSDEKGVAPKKCRITLKSIKKGILPPLDDEFAKKVGQESIAKLKEFIVERLTTREEKNSKEVARNNLCYELLKNYPIDLPRSLIEAETKGRIACVKQAKDMKKGSLPIDSQQEKQLKHDIEIMVERFFICMYLLRQFASQANIAISQEEMMEEIHQQTMILPPEERLIYPGLETDDIRNRLFMKIMMRKCADWVIAQSSTQK